MKRWAGGGVLKKKRQHTTQKRLLCKAAQPLLSLALVPFVLGTAALIGAMSNAKIPSMDAPLYDAIIVPAGGQTPEGPPPHVLERLKRAAKLYNASPDPKPYVITTARGTVHKPCPQDDSGFERPEAADNAAFLMKRGVHPSRLLEESVSLETVGNAFFARVLHADLRGFRKLAVINNSFHMTRTRAVFEHVFGLPGGSGEGRASPYDLTFVEVEDRLPPDVLKVRLEKEAVALPKFQEGGPWRAQTKTLAAMHHWMYNDNTAYASKRLLEERKLLDPKLLNSY